MNNAPDSASFALLSFFHSPHLTAKCEWIIVDLSIEIFNSANYWDSESCLSAHGSQILFTRHDFHKIS